MNPLFLFLLLFVGIPVVELYFMIQVGAEIGALPTVLLVLFTAGLGGFLVRMQGFATAMRVRDTMDRGEIPAIEMMEGAVLLLCGVLLLLPGFVTDTVGFLLLVPPLRRGLILWLLKRTQVIWPAGRHGAHPRTPPDHRIIDAEYKRDDE